LSSRALKKVKGVDFDAWDMLPSQRPVYMDDWSERVMFAAGLGAGKTHVGVRKALKLSALNRHVAGGFLVPDYTSYGRDVHPEFLKIFEELGLKQHVHWKWNENKKCFRFKWSKAPLYIFTAEKAIAGPNLGWGVINEFSLIPWMRIKEFLERIRVRCPVPQTNFVGTPEDRHGWLEDFVERQQLADLEAVKEGLYIFSLYHGHTRENHHNRDRYADQVASNLDDRAQEVFMGGKIMRLHGDYFYYAFSTERNVSTDAEYFPGEQIYANMDFNVGRMSTTLCHMRNNGGDFFDEIVLLGNSDTPQMARALIEKYSGTCPIRGLPIYTTLKIIIDASARSRSSKGLSDYEALIKEGFRPDQILFKAANPLMRNRQLLVNGRLGKGMTRFHPRCKETIKDMKRVKQLIDFTKDKKDPTQTHLSDTVDYFHDYHYTLGIERRSGNHRD
jgi:hypothetical protein